MKISLFFAWYDLYIGMYWDREELRLYILPIPCCGVVIDFWQWWINYQMWMLDREQKAYRRLFDEEESPPEASTPARADDEC